MVISTKKNVTLKIDIDIISELKYFSESKYITLINGYSWDLASWIFMSSESAPPLSFPQ